MSTQNLPEFTSTELQNASTIKASITVPSTPTVYKQDIINVFHQLLLNKGLNALASYNIGNLLGKSSITSFKDFINELWSIIVEIVKLENKELCKQLQTININLSSMLDQKLSTEELENIIVAWTGALLKKINDNSSNN